MAEQNNPVIIKRVKKAAHGHHGGAWKIAYADFVTAMMAFFLLMWLLNAVTEEQLQGISDYFAPAAISKSQSGAGGMLGGQTIGEGAMVTTLTSPSMSVNLPPPTIGSGGDDFRDPADLSEQTLDQAIEAREEAEFEAAEEAIRQAIQEVPDLAELSENILVDNTPEGLRIQLVDQEGLAMFPSGSANMFEHTQRLMDLIARAIKQLPGKQLSITGHTDATRFANEASYGNWELSADRALASRRALIRNGVPEGQIVRVAGRADLDPLFPDTPNDPRNRRLSIVVLKHADAGPTPENTIQLDGRTAAPPSLFDIEPSAPLP